MTTLRHRIVFACLSIAGTAGLVSFSNPAAAAPIDETRQATVVTADLAVPTDRATSARHVADGAAD